MPGRFLLAGIFASIGTMALAAAPGLPEGDARESAARLRLNCTGTMITADQPAPGGQVVADGLIDFAERRVRGFSVGSQPIVLLTASVIDFGSAPPAGTIGNIVEGSIDRQTGHTRIRVSSPRQPSEAKIELSLACEFEQPVS
jgi:hypothetical protein